MNCERVTHRQLGRDFECWSVLIPQIVAETNPGASEGLLAVLTAECFENSLTSGNQKSIANA